MAPVEWPIAAGPAGPAANPTRRVDRDRLPTVRADFFLSPTARLTEQERALMTAMLADLVAVIADEIGVAAELRPSPANDLGGELFERVFASGLLDIPELVGLLLTRAEQERVASGIRPLGKAGPARFLHMLAASDDPAVAAAAMAVILGRSRRRDRFDAPRIDLNDVPADAAVLLVHAVGAALRVDAGGHADRRLSSAASAVLSRHDEGKRMEALAFALVHALEQAGRLDDEALRSALGDAELQVFTEALSRRAGIDAGTAWNCMARGGRDFACLLRLASLPRQFAAEIAAAVGETGALGPADVITHFDSLGEDEVERERNWLRLDRHYRQAANALGSRHGDSAD